MNVEEIYQLLFGDKYEVINMSTATPSERLNYVTQYYDQFRLCGGCDCLIFIKHGVCPYCSSYNFKSIDEDFVLNMDETSKHIDYYIPLE